MKSIFRFGQPIGTALVIVAFVETIYSLFWLFLDFVSLEQTSNFNFFCGSADFEFFGHLLWHFLLAIHFLMSCIFWVAVIFESRKPFLYLWLVLSFVHNILFVAFIVSQLILRPISQSTLVYFAVVFFTVWRCYTMSIACQCLRRLRNKYDFQSGSVSDLDICLEPLGSGFWQTWEYFKDLPGVGAVTILTVELVWNVINLCTRPLVMQIFGLAVHRMPLKYVGGMMDFLLVEETVIRCGRIFLDCVCIYFLFKEKLTAVRVWVCFYFLQFVMSNMVAAFMITHWWTVVPEVPFVVFHVLIILLDNLFRITILYFCIKYGMVHVRTIAKL